MNRVTRTSFEPTAVGLSIDVLNVTGITREVLHKNIRLERNSVLIVIMYEQHL